MASEPQYGPGSRLEEILALERPRIHVVLRDHIGGNLLAVPALRGLRHKYPHAFITLACNGLAAPVMQRSPYVDEVLHLFTYRAGAYGRHAGAVMRAVNQGALFMTIRHKVDLAVHLKWTGPQATRMYHFAGALAQVGHQQGPSDIWTTHSVGDYPADPRPREVHAAVMRALGIRDYRQDLEVWIENRDRAWLADWLWQRKIEVGEPYIVFHPRGHWGCNEWTPDRWARLGDRLQHEYGWPVVITGTREDREEAEAIADLMQRRPVVAAGHTSASRFMALVERARLVVGVDTLVTTVSLATRTPAVILFGAGDLYERGPAVGEPLRLLRKQLHRVDVDMSTPHCWTHMGACHNPQCPIRDSRPLLALQVEDVLQAARRQIEATEGHAAVPYVDPALIAMVEGQEDASSLDLVPAAPGVERNGGCDRVHAAPEPAPLGLD